MKTIINNNSAVLENVNYSPLGAYILKMINEKGTEVAGFNGYILPNNLAMFDDIPCLINSARYVDQYLVYHTNEVESDYKTVKDKVVYVAEGNFTEYEMQNRIFAHGETVEIAINELKAKLSKKKPLEERIAYFKE